jgi:hypothetical protein
MAQQPGEEAIGGKNAVIIENNRFNHTGQS